VKHLIYPVPNPELPFLGIHLTRMIDGSVTVGPNALQGWKREGYGRINISFRDIFAMIRFPGFWIALRKNFRAGLHEFRNSIWKRGYLKQIHKYCPSIPLARTSATSSIAVHQLLALSDHSDLQSEYGKR